MDIRDEIEEKLADFRQEVKSSLCLGDIFLTFCIVFISIS
ncbi:hypothetical protein SSU05_1195 [Streptococcus suis 05ZYH33]|nr:hypothetical protein SSU05_1195 [Streptococcus suis 05ZYH33]